MHRPGTHADRPAAERERLTGPRLLEGVDRLLHETGPIAHIAVEHGELRRHVAGAHRDVEPPTAHEPPIAQKGNAAHIPGLPFQHRRLDLLGSVAMAPAANVSGVGNLAYQKALTSEQLGIMPSIVVVFPCLNISTCLATRLPCARTLPV